MKDEKIDFKDDVKTKVTSLKKVIEDKLMQIRDLATLEVMLPIEARLTERMKSLKRISSAESLKINKHWKTITPEMHIRNLEAKKINNDEGFISFEVYETDENGNKKVYENQVELELHDGSKIKRTTSADYRIAYEVKEIFKRNKPVEREIIKLNEE